MQITELANFLKQNKKTSISHAVHHSGCGT